MHHLFKFRIAPFCQFGIVAFLSTNILGQSFYADSKLWYDEPAEDYYMEALPIGNGYMGALIRGKPDLERIPLNEETTWSGGPGESEDYNFGNRPGAYQYLEPVRDLMRAGDLEAAYKLIQKELFGTIGERPKRSRPGSVNEPLVRNPEDGLISFPGFGNNQTTVDLLVNVKAQGPVKNYKRSLDLGKAVSTVEYDQEGVQHKRLAFASYPDRVLVFRFENNAMGGLDYGVWMETFHEAMGISFDSNYLTMDAVLKNNGMKFQSRVRIHAPGASVRFDGSQIEVLGATTLDLYVTIASDYLNNYPVYKGRDHSGLIDHVFAGLEDESFEMVYQRHLDDYQSLYERVELSLGDASRSDLPTDERLKHYSAGEEDPEFEALYFQFGRYLLISSSRPGSLPAHLQGKWNVQMDPQWACDYHTDINLQMNYWPAEVLNLPETHKPLFDYITSLQEPGRQSTKDFFDARGWIVNTMNNIFGYTAVNWGSWGYAPAAAGWLCRHLWEHYEYTRDDAFLEKTAYPLMLDAALFWLDYLIEDEDGYLVSMPSFSPEHGGISYGASMDHQIVWDLFNNLLKAAAILDKEDEILADVRAALDKLLPPAIGRYGQLQEWKIDRDDPENQHRHVSHLYALYPGYQITPFKTPELADAARKTLQFRGDGGTGWSMAWKINFWARLLDGEHAYKLLRVLLSYCSNYNHENMSLPGGTYPNLFCAHPPFQIDGNFGGVAGMAEMLLQSHSNRIHLLPAIPKAWSTGSFKGLKARGGYELDMVWENGEVVTLKVASTEDQVCRILTPNPLTGEKVRSTSSEYGWETSFTIDAGEVVHLVDASKAQP